jgi:hypothetical protein
LFGTTVYTHAQQYSEIELKAAYLYNFTLFVEWPQHTLSQNYFTIGVYKDEDMYIILTEMLRGRKVGKLPIKIIEVKQLKDAQKADLLYFGKETSDNELKDILDIIAHKPVLSVGNEIEDFCYKGGIINFRPEYFKKRFEINNEKALSLGLKISSKLLVLSKIIKANENRF